MPSRLNGTRKPRSAVGLVFPMRLRHAGDYGLHQAESIVSFIFNVAYVLFYYVLFYNEVIPHQAPGYRASAETSVVTASS